MTSWFRALFLISSFGPLYAVLAAQLYVQREKVDGWLFFAACFAISVAVFLWLQNGFKSKSPMHNSVDVIEPLDENILTYVLAYTPPLFIDDFSSPEKLVPALLFYAVLFTLMIRTETIYINPFFLWLGYRVYRVKLESGRQVIIISRAPEIIGREKLNLYEIERSRFYYAT